MMTRLLPAGFVVVVGLWSVPMAAAAAEPREGDSPIFGPTLRVAARKSGQSPEAAKAEAATGPIDATFAQFLKDPTEESFLKVQKLVMSHPLYAPYSQDLDEIAELLEQGKLRESLDKLAKAMPNLLLSPRAHEYAATAAKKLGDEAAAKKEAAIAEKCIRALLATGDGSEKRPIIVTRVSDEYDVVHSLKKKVFGQGLRKKDDKSFDVLQCSGGAVMWFDVTVPFGTMFKKKVDGKGGLAP